MVARLNVEVQFWAEVADLIVALGDKDRAYGMALRFFRDCQNLYKVGKVMSEEEFKSAGYSEALFPNLARRTEFGIVAVGADKHFAWLKERAEAGRTGGKKSATRPRDEMGRLLPNGSKQTPSKTKQTQASYSYSFSKEENNTTTAAKVDSDQIREAYEVWINTLASFGIPATRMGPTQEYSLTRAILQLGFENVLLALEGARYEPPGDKFKPREHLSIDRCLHRDAKGVSRWEKFKNLALGKRAERERALKGTQEAEARP